MNVHSFRKSLVSLVVGASLLTVGGVASAEEWVVKNICPNCNNIDMQPTLYDVNNNGEVLGIMNDHGSSRPFVWSKLSGIKFIDPGSLGIYPTAFNDRLNFTGIGVSYTSPAVITNGSIYYLPFGAPLTGSATSINNNREVVGTYISRVYPNSNVLAPYAWSEQFGGVSLPLYPGHVVGQATVISDSGKIIGLSSPSYDQSGHMIVWNKVSNGLYEIANLQGFPSYLDFTRPYDINGNTIVGNYSSSGFIWDPIKLFRTIPINQAVNVEAKSIDNLGRVVGRYAFNDVDGHVRHNNYVWSEKEGLKILPRFSSDQEEVCGPSKIRGNIIIVGLINCYGAAVIWETKFSSQCDFNHNNRFDLADAIKFVVGCRTGKADWQCDIDENGKFNVKDTIAKINQCLPNVSYSDAAKIADQASK